MKFCYTVTFYSSEDGLSDIEELVWSAYEDSGRCKFFQTLPGVIDSASAEEIKALF